MHDSRTVRTHMSSRICAAAAVLFAGLGLLLQISCTAPRDPLPPELYVIRPDVTTGLSNGGWNRDRYEDLKPLNARTSIVVGDLTGPGVIRHIHTTRHWLFNPKMRPASFRGIELEITFDDAEQPAVRSPLADFFGHGCDGEGEDFSSNLIECAPGSYNCYFSMPFRKRARIVLRNNTDADAVNYSYVEWESLPRWDDSYGYFHATYIRKSFQLRRDTEVDFFDVRGKGHLIGRQFSIVTREPLFKGFRFIMEGNNEVSIDGRERVLDYLGSEDSFTFSWGFRKLFSGRRAGITCLKEEGDTSMLSVYRFHDHMPIRFQESLSWRISWKHEVKDTKRIWLDLMSKLEQSIEGGGGWVEYATVFYWYGVGPR